MLTVSSTPVELIDDNTAEQYYNDFDTLEGAERDSRAEALRLWAEQKKSDQNREQFDTLNKIYSDFDGYVNDAGLQDFDEESRYRTANRQFIASQFDDTVENQQTIYPSFRDKWTESVAGKKGLSEKETFDLIKQGIDARNEVSQAANEIPGDIALALFDSLDGGDPVDVPKLIDTWKTKNAESIKKLPKGWETPLLEAAQKYHTETDTMLRDYAEPLKQVYDHFAAVTGRDTERAGESNPKNQEELDSLVDTLASMPKPVRERAYASVVLGAKKAGQDPKTFMDQWGESWSRTLNMVRTGALTAQEMAAESESRQLEDKASPPDYYISKSTGEKIPLANRAFHDEADLRKVTPEEIAADAAKARQKVKRFEVVRELQSVADNQFDPIEKINKGGFLGFMEAMAYGTPQSLAYTGTALIPVVGPYLAGTAIFADEYNQLREQGMSVNQAVQVGSVSAGIQAGLERTGAELIFGKLPVFEKLMRRIANPARVGKAGSAGIRFFSAALGENITEGAQDLTTPLVQDVAEALGADVPDVQWQPILEKWSGSRLDVLAATIPTILLGTGVATFGDNKRFAQFEERQDIYRSMGMDDATIKEIEDGKDISEKQQKFQTAFSKLTPENVKTGVAYMEEKIASAQGQQQDPNTPTLTRATLADGTTQFIVRDEQGRIAYRTAEEQSAQIAMRELLRNQITGSTRGIVESLQFIDQVNQAAGRGEDVQKLLLDGAPRTLLDDYEANPTQQNLDNLFATVRAFGQDINEPAELANFPVLASNQGALAEGIFKSVIRIQDGATGVEVMRDFSQDNLKRAIGEGRVTMDWVREQLNQVIPLIESDRLEGRSLRTETDTDVIESFSDVAVAYMNGRIRDEQVPAGFRGFLRRMAIVVKDIFRRAYRLKRAIAEGKVDSNFETFLAESVGLNQQAIVDTTRERVGNEVLTDTNFSLGNVSRVDENGIHPFAKPRPSTYADPNESEFDPSAILETLVRGKTGADSAKRRKHGRTLASFSEIVDWAKSQGRTIDPSIFAERKELGSGGEHLVFQSENGRVYKLTKPGLFGIQADDAGAYLQRWALANRLFNDDARIEGIVKLPGESDYRTVISHRHIDGRDSTRAEIQDYLQSHGFVQVESQWIHPTLGIAALDAETAGNSITMPDGTVAPVDLNLQPASPQYLQQAREQTGIGGQSNFSIAVPANFISQVSDKDDQFRVGTAKLGTAKVPKETPQESNISGDIVPDDLLAKQMEKINYAHLPKNILSEKDPKKKRRKLINWFKKNLLALHDAFPEEFRARATRWYDGANRIARELGGKFQASVEQASGVIAVFSPQKDWFMNVAQAEQFMELWANSQDVVLEEALVRAEIEGIIEAAVAPDKQKRKKTPGETKEQTAERREYNKALDDRAKSDRRKKVEQVIGKTIRQLDSEPDLQGWAIRVLAQVTFGRNYRNLSPEGDRLGMATNDDGALAKNGWGSINEIEKAVRIMKDGSLKNISDNLGNEHKVRNFYNNIVAPNTPYGDATIDTHAVAAAHLMPYGAKATEVGHNFGSKMNGSEVLGISGVYHLYLDAYREAAADRGILPRQMQSVTWEAIRLVYPAANKNAASLAKAEKTWQVLTDANARNTLVGGRIPSPVWAGTNDNRESQGNPAELGKTFGQESISGRGLLSGVRPAGAGRDGVADFSISTPRDIQRVSRAFDDAARSPEERIATFERAKRRFFSVLSANQQALDDLRGGTVSFRRTQLLQALGELDAILSVFPPDIRGRVGGYTRLAGIAPHDVFKDGEKVSEVSGMKGAIISAWMKEGQNIGQAGKQTALPPGYTAKENLSTARADRAIAEFFKNRIEVLDRELEKTLRREYDEAFQKLLDRTKPKKAKPGEKPKGIGADVQDLFVVVREAVNMSATDVAAHIAGLDAKIASGELTAEQEARAQVEAALVSLVGDWKNASADRRKSAFMEASRIWNGAYAAHAQKVIAQRQQREVARLNAVVATGKAGEMSGRKAKAIRDSGLKGTWKDFFLNLLNFDQVAGVLFGENSEVANTMIDAQRKAENAKEDGSQAKMQELEDFFTQLAGGNLLDGEKLRYDLAQPSMTVQGIKLSQLEGLSAVMMWVQEDGRRHMEGELDELGNPIGAWHYNQAFIDEILNNLSDEALALRSWLLRRYADEYTKINEVYSELNGVNLPQIQFYSPITVQPLSAPTGQVLDPVSGSAMSGASTSPGALRTRGTAIAEPRFQDALQTYISHTLQMEHWKAFAPFVAEANGILRNRDVQNSVEEKGGAEARKVLNAWLDYFAQGGVRDAGAHLALNQGLSNVLGRASQVALVGRISTILIQSTQLGAAMAEMPVKAYLKRMGKLLTGQLGWTDALNSDYIQRRVAQMPPVVQMAMQGLKGAKPAAIQQAGKRLGMLLSGADGLFTAGTYAITYDYHLTKAKELGLAGQEADDYARNTAERVTDRIAQPTRPGARSLYENTSTNPLARAGWAFASEARKNLALVAYSFAQRDIKTRMRTLAYVVAINSIGASILRSIWRDILDDEDDELFDDKYWSPKRIAMAVATEPFYGFPVLGSVVQEAVYKSFGEFKPAGSLFSVDNAVGPIKRLPDYLSGDFEMRDVMRDIDMVVSALGIMHPNIAAAASISHLARDLFNIGDSAVDAVTED